TRRALRALPPFPSAQATRWQSGQQLPGRGSQTTSVCLHQVGVAKSHNTQRNRSLRRARSRSRDHIQKVKLTDEEGVAEFQARVGKQTFGTARYKLARAGLQRTVRIYRYARRMFR